MKIKLSIKIDDKEFSEIYNIKDEDIELNPHINWITFAMDRFKFKIKQEIKSDR